MRGTHPRVAGAGSEMSWNLSVFRTLLEDDIYGIATSVSQGFFQNIGDTRRQGIEAGLNYRGQSWSAYANYSFVQATFRSPSPCRHPRIPFRMRNGNIQVEPGDRLPGIPEHRLKLGADYRILPDWTVGATVNVVSSFYLRRRRVQPARADLRAIRSSICTPHTNRARTSSSSPRSTISSIASMRPGASSAIPRASARREFRLTASPTGPESTIDS